MDAGPPTVANFLATHHVMTLATQGDDGPWAAAVFYAWVDGAMLFLSAPGTRHAKNLANDPRCAATIQDDTGDWKSVRGIQLEGRVECLEGEAANLAHRRYAEKFPLVSPLATLPAPIAVAIARIRWYRLRPQRMYYIDNAKGFGHREQVDLNQ